MYPFVTSVNFITNTFMRILGVDPKRAQVGDALNSEELRAVVNEAGNMIPASHQEMLLSILDLEKVTVEDVMIPRNEIVGIDINDDVWIIKKIEHARRCEYCYTATISMMP